MVLRRIATPYKVKVTRGAAAASPAKSHMALLQIIRWDPSTNKQAIESYEFQKKQDFMVLDLLTAVKAHQDPSLAFRASCCEGVCGSCAMNINGANSLACVTYATNHTIVGPLPNFPVLKDLVVDLRHFFRQYAFIRPFVRNINLHRYHADNIVSRYEKTRKALYGDSPKELLALEAGNEGVKESDVETVKLYKQLLNKTIISGDTNGSIEVLKHLSKLVKIPEEEVKKVMNETMKNLPIIPLHSIH